METVLLIEDDRSLARELSAKIQGAGYKCVCASDARSGLEAFKQGGVELVLLDLGLPDRDGEHVLEVIRASSAVPIVVLTARRTGNDKVKALDAGADDYVVKPVWSGELLARIRAVLRRSGGVNAQKATEEVVRFGQVTVWMGKHRVEVAGRDVHLTPTEMGLLLIFVRRRGQALSRERLMDAVLGPDGGALEALQSHVSRLRKKLGADGTRIETLWGVGYRLRVDADPEEG